MISQEYAGGDEGARFREGSGRPGASPIVIVLVPGAAAQRVAERSGNPRRTLVLAYVWRIAGAMTV